MIYVISLKTATDRRESIQQQFDAIDMDFEFFDAIDGRKGEHSLFEKYNRKKRLRYKGCELTKGELGCFASHYLLWEKCVQLNQSIVVIEDDAQLEPNFKDDIEKILNIKKHEYLRLFVNGRYRPFNNLEYHHGFDIVQYKRGPGATRAYLLYPQAARKFISAAQEWYLPVDDYMDQFWLNHVPCKGIRPGVVKNETEFDSTVGELSKKEKKNRLTRELYSLKCTVLRTLHFMTNKEG
ncbi:glycosyltransferase family 25 protein [Aliivibrio finisterrensis]|uniref:glycosyltransferase family 25 protein n=1 Tax=Aliivibrio finisterrensis TaxID=511998 RepID=UPI00101F5E08|nr:glycosyltransferase family 25 protein [Aliivibrio finisterrensis]RYU67848.1 glycosyltransferase family 25 protein [Aliivibrio finisterrensis]RYU71507.1 glycosyltransferase family 25 protein [Aliivibrio finisterrensis]RYU74669.1 glycosyltransferase family 25 protein [Aliivibrio finisterrensis]